MNSTIQSDLTKSSEAFDLIVWPDIKKNVKKFEKAEYLKVEIYKGDKMRFNLDVLSGIDAYIIDEHGCIGVATRVQFGDNYESFTIRKARFNKLETEFSKRVYAIEKDIYCYPKLTVQAYMGYDGKLLGWCIAYTKDLIDIAQEGLCPVRKTTNASFFVIDWQILKELRKKHISVNY